MWLGRVSCHCTCYNSPLKTRRKFSTTTSVLDERVIQPRIQAALHSAEHTNTRTWSMLTVTPQTPESPSTSCVGWFSCRRFPMRRRRLRHEQSPPGCGGAGRVVGLPLLGGGFTYATAGDFLRSVSSDSNDGTGAGRRALCFSVGHRPRQASVESSTERLIISTIKSTHTKSKKG